MRIRPDRRGHRDSSRQAGVIERNGSNTEGRNLKAGAVAAVKAVRNPISTARLVMDRSRDVTMTERDDAKCVRENGSTGTDPACFSYGELNFSDVALPEEFDPMIGFAWQDQATGLAAQRML